MTKELNLENFDADYNKLVQFISSIRNLTNNDFDKHVTLGLTFPIDITYACRSGLDRMFVIVNGEKDFSMRVTSEGAIYISELEMLYDGTLSNLVFTKDQTDKQIAEGVFRTFSFMVN